MPPDQTLGVLAGGGPLPRRIVEACKRQGRPVFVAVLDGHGDPSDYQDVPHQSVRLGAAGTALAKLGEAGCGQVVLAGTVRRPNLRELRPDWWGIKFFAKSGAAVLGDDGLLRALIRAIEAEGFTVCGADEIVPELLMPAGLIGSRVPDKHAEADIVLALQAARNLGAADAGQAAVVRDGQVIAEEGPAGTDAMLRALADANNSGGVLAKTLKPGQERRADLPMLGSETLRNAAAAGLAGIVVEAGNAFLIDRDDAAKLADELGLFMLGVAPPETGGGGSA